MSTKCVNVLIGICVLTIGISVWGVFELGTPTQQLGSLGGVQQHDSRVCDDGTAQDFDIHSAGFEGLGQRGGRGSVEAVQAPSADQRTLFENASARGIGTRTGARRERLFCSGLGGEPGNANSGVPLPGTCSTMEDRMSRFQHVMLDPGHGGENTGVVAGGHMEKEITLAICKAARKAVGSSIRCTRYAEVYRTRAQRVERSKAWGTKLVISVHCDSGPKSWHGANVFYWSGNDYGKRVATAIAEHMPKSLYTGRIWTADKKLWPRVNAVLRDYPMTAVLVECGYMTNVDDLKVLSSPSTHSQLAEAILAGADVRE